MYYYIYTHLNIIEFNIIHTKILKQRILILFHTLYNIHTPMKHKK